MQRERTFGIVDEVDNILIDEARTPLIISGQAEESADLYYTFARLVPKLRARPEGAEEGGDYFVDLKDRAVSPTELGIDKMEGYLKIPNLYDADPRLARHFEQALRAHALYKRDRDYIVKDGEIVIVDEFTGRQMPGRRWSEGLHQAIEAKEGLRVQRESVTLATITFQNYFRLYDKLAGMTGTAMTEAEEFHKIYKLEVVSIPTHRPMVRDDDADLVYRNEKGKFAAVIDEIVEMQEAGRPVLVGTVSVEKSEMLAEMLKRRGIRHEVLNAKLHEKEAGVIAQAGRAGAVTIATNMAGRGTDILLGGNPAGLASEILHRRGLNPAEVDAETYAEALAEAKAITGQGHAEVVAAGGLHIIGTERHDSRRIDNQLRGRAGRQGDPGSSRFYLSLDDDLMKRFANERVAGLMERLGLDEETPIESRLVSKTIESAQTRVEGFNFDIRKRVVEFDDVINRQRETIYAERDKVLRNEDLTETVQTFLDDEIDDVVERFLSAEQPDDWNMEGLAAALAAMGLTGEGTSEDELWDVGSRDAISQHLRTLVDQALDTREAAVGADDWATVERFVLLRTIDSLWVEHLTELDDMRRGIGLRGYAQQDPLNEFRKEAFGMYEELRGLIRHQVATTIFRVSVTRQAPIPQGAQPLVASGALTPEALAAAGRGAGPAAAATSSTTAGGRAATLTTGSATAAGLPAAPAMRAVRESLGDQPIAERVRIGRLGGRQARLHAERAADRPQRPLLLRLRQQVQEVPRTVNAPPAPRSAHLKPRRVARDLLALGTAATVGVALVAGYAAFRIDQQGQRDEQRHAGAIVVLGAAQYDGRPSGVFAARIDHAVRLYFAGVADRLVVTGGRQPGDRTTEAAVARTYAIARGVPEDAILAEDEGRSTLESLTSVAEILRENGIRDAVFVSDRTHMLRVLRIARDLGLTAYGSPTTTSPSDHDANRRFRATIHELGALAVYFLTGREGRRPATTAADGG